jgi:ferredoxin
LIWLAALAVAAFSAVAEQRFPPPDFEGGYRMPSTTTPPARALILQYLDVAVLVGALATATWLVLKKRSRKSVLLLSLFSVLYFGLWRKGCVCSIGSLQNVALALADRGYALPLVVAAFFVVPLFFALVGGRVFCAGVCPHGALQDLVLLKPIKVPDWLEQGLSLLPFVYLGVGVLFAATGSAFVICQYDPFIPIFRLSGQTMMVVAGVALLLLGTVVGRPYCRFLCPYGALLKLAGLVSKWRVRVTPDDCPGCRMCEAACPYGAIRAPESAPTEPRVLAWDRARLGWMIALLPLLIASGAFLGSRLGLPASRVHPGVVLAERLVLEKDVARRPGPQTDADLALGRARQARQEILEQAAQIRGKFVLGGWIFGGWVGLVIGAKLISQSIRRTRAEYEPDPGSCVACARCFEFCPKELTRRRALSAAAVPAVANGNPSTVTAKV